MCRIIFALIVLVPSEPLGQILVQINAVYTINALVYNIIVSVCKK